MLKDLMYFQLAAAEEVGNPVENPQDDVAETVETEAPEVKEETPFELDLDGEKLTLEQIKEFKKGYMRQSDYTRKTQEIATQRKETQDAIELYEYLRSNPEIAKQLAEFSPEDKKELANRVDPLAKRVEQLDTQLRVTQLENQLNDVLKNDQYGVNEIELLEIAQKEGCDINKAYKLWKADNADKIIEKRLEEGKKKIGEEIQKNYGVTKTLIKGGDKPAVSDFGLTEQEKIMAKKLDMSEEEYSKWK
jgi:hypothetical protein